MHPSISHTHARARARALSLSPSLHRSLMNTRREKNQRKRRRDEAGKTRGRRGINSNMKKKMHPCKRPPVSFNAPETSLPSLSLSPTLHLSLMNSRIQEFKNSRKENHRRKGRRRRRRRRKTNKKRSRRSGNHNNNNNNNNKKEDGVYNNAYKTRIITTRTSDAWARAENSLPSRGATTGSVRAVAR